MHKLKAALSLILICAVLLFAIQNAATVELNFLFWSFSAPRALVFIVLLGLGFVFGRLVSSLKAMGARDD